MGGSHQPSDGRTDGQTSIPVNAECVSVPRASLSVSVIITHKVIYAPPIETHSITAAYRISRYLQLYEQVCQSTTAAAASSSGSPSRHCESESERSSSSSAASELEISQSGLSFSSVAAVDGASCVHTES